MRNRSELVNAFQNVYNKFDTLDNSITTLNDAINRLSSKFVTPLDLADTLPLWNLSLGFKVFAILDNTGMNGRSMDKSLISSNVYISHGAKINKFNLDDGGAASTLANLVGHFNLGITVNPDESLIYVGDANNNATINVVNLAGTLVDSLVFTASADYEWEDSLDRYLAFGVFIFIALTYNQQEEKYYGITTTDTDDYDSLYLVEIDMESKIIYPIYKMISRMYIFDMAILDNTLYLSTWAFTWGISGTIFDAGNRIWLARFDTGEILGYAPAPPSSSLYTGLTLTSDGSLVYANSSAMPYIGTLQHTQLVHEVSNKLGSLCSMNNKSLGIVSVEIFPSNKNREYLLIRNEDTSAIVYIDSANPATISGYPIYPKTSLEISGYTGPIYGISDEAATDIRYGDVK